MKSVIHTKDGLHILLDLSKVKQIEIVRGGFRIVYKDRRTPDKTVKGVIEIV